MANIVFSTGSSFLELLPRPGFNSGVIAGGASDPSLKDIGSILSPVISTSSDDFATGVSAANSEIEDGEELAQLLDS